METTILEELSKCLRKKGEKGTLTQSLLETAYHKYFYSSGYINTNKEIDESTRYSSWDLCYNHFQEFFKKPIISSEDKRNAGLHLGFYLASWGMFRNSKLLGYGIQIYKELAEKLHLSRGKEFKDQYNNIKLFLKDKEVSPRVTLITKIMLGVYGNTPAIDDFVLETLKKYCVGIYEYDNDGEKVLKKINKIFEIPIQGIQGGKIDETIGKFIDEKKNLPEAKNLSREKILDAIFFEIGRVISEEEKKNKSSSKNSE